MELRDLPLIMQRPISHSTEELRLLDRQHLWHPFTPMKLWDESEPLVITAAEGMHLIDSDGNRYLDGVSSLWCNVHGHRVPEIDAPSARSWTRSPTRRCSAWPVSRPSCWPTG